MADMTTLDDIYRAAVRLPAAQQAELVRRLETLRSAASEQGLTREKALAEFERREANGAFEKTPDLRDKYHHPQFDLTDEQLRAEIHEFSTEWEKDLDEYGSDDNM